MPALFLIHSHKHKQAVQPGFQEIYIHIYKEPIIIHAEVICIAHVNGHIYTNIHVQTST